MEITNAFTMLDGEGKEEQYTALNMVENPENGVKYVLYTETANLQDISGKDINIYAAVYKKEGDQIILEPVDSENDWQLIQKLVSEIVE